MFRAVIQFKKEQCNLFLILGIKSFKCTKETCDITHYSCARKTYWLLPLLVTELKQNWIAYVQLIIL